MKALSTLVILSLLTIAFARAHQPLASLVCVLALGAYLFNIPLILKLIWQTFKPSPKPMKNLPKGFTITQIEMTKPMDYLHQTYPNKNDAEILQIREAEMVQILNDFCKAYDKSTYDKHFKLKAYYAYPDNTKELVLHFEPKTPIANEFLGKVMEHKMEQGDYYMDDDD